MFKIFANGRSIMEPLAEDLTISAPKLTLEMGKSGSLTFTVPPNHQYRAQLNQLSTIVTVEWDGVEIFRGRVLTNKRTFNNSRSITCEGIMSYLVDSVQKAEKYQGGTHDLFRKIIASHNEMVEPEKQFAVGSITIEDREIILAGKSKKDERQTQDLETKKFDPRQIVIDSIVDDWQTTLDYIESCLIDYCGGYLRVRRVGNVNYIDLIKDYGGTAIQEIMFGYNLLDYNHEASPDDLFTVLIPLGDENLTIESVNNGSIELVDTAAVERYGRIVKTHVFESVNKPQTLLENGLRFLENHENMPITITVKAVDMHLVDKSVKEIYLGDRVYIKSFPHDMVGYLTCTKIEYDMDNPANNTYTFGNPHQTMTDRYRKDKKKSGGGGGGGGAGSAGAAAAQYAEENTESELNKFFDAWINVQPDQGHIDLGTLYRGYVGDRQTLEQTCGISLDAPSGNINIRSFRQEFGDHKRLVAEQVAQINVTSNELAARIDLEAGRTDDLEDGLKESNASITVLSNSLEAQIKLEAKHHTELDKDIKDSNASIKLVADDLKAQISLEAIHYSNTTKGIENSNASIKSVADDLKAQISLEAIHYSNTTKGIETSNASIKAVADDLKAQIELEASHNKSLDEKITNSNASIELVAKDTASTAKVVSDFQKETAEGFTKANGRIDFVQTETASLSKWSTNYQTQVDDKFIQTSSAITQLNDKTKSWMQLTTKYQEDNDKNIAAITLRADKQGSAIELKADTVTVDSKVLEVKGMIDADRARIKTLEGDMAKIDTVIANKVTSMLTASANITCGTLEASNSVKSDSLIEGNLINATGFLRLKGDGVATQKWVEGKGYLAGKDPSVNTLSASSSVYIGGQTAATRLWVDNNYATKALVTEYFATTEWVLEQLKNYAPADHNHSWSSITNKPTQFTPVSHRHTYANSISLSNGHTHNVKIGNTSYTTGGVSTNSTHDFKVTGRTGYYPDES